MVVNEPALAGVVVVVTNNFRHRLLRYCCTLIGHYQRRAACEVQGRLFGGTFFLYACFMEQLDTVLCLVYATRRFFYVRWPKFAG